MAENKDFLEIAHTSIDVFKDGEFHYHELEKLLDIALKDGTDDDTYLRILDDTLPKLIASVQPDFIFYQSGVDVLSTDKLGRLGLSMSGCQQRDQQVLSLAKEHQIPIAVSMGGGYSEDIRIILEAHANPYRTAQELFF